MFWKHPITKKNRFLPVVHATNGIPSYFDHDLSKTSRSTIVLLVHTKLGCIFEIWKLELGCIFETLHNSLMRSGTLPKQRTETLLTF